MLRNSCGPPSTNTPPSPKFHIQCPPQIIHDRGNKKRGKPRNAKCAVKQTTLGTNAYQTGLSPAGSYASASLSSVKACCQVMPLTLGIRTWNRVPCLPVTFRVGLVNYKDAHCYTSFLFHSFSPWDSEGGQLRVYGSERIGPD